MQANDGRRIGFQILSLIAVSIGTGTLILDPPVAEGPQSPLTRVEVEPDTQEFHPKDFLGYESCRKCHADQVRQLQKTQHFKSFETLHRHDNAKQYCQRLGLRSVKCSQRCIVCHYTPEQGTRGIRAQSGVSCESCHGAARSWVKGHNDYGGLLVTKRRESPEHRVRRIESSIAAGMRHPSNVFLLAQSCYRCHIVNDAEIVNKTNHTAYTRDFNVVSWSQGSIRHNFLRTEGASNAISSPERLRVMFVADLLARLQAALNAMVNAPRDSKHFRQMQQLYTDAAHQLLAVSERVEISLIQRAIAALDQTPPTSESLQLAKTAKALGAVGMAWGQADPLPDLRAIQSMLPKSDQYR